MKINDQIFLKPSYLVSKDMEASFYHDTNMRNNEAMNKLKSNMSLDFGAAPTKKRATQTSNLLNSPDLNLLKLASPELERLIIQQSNGMVTTTPTPTQFMNPKFVTEEQEEYARGFVNALTKLHENEFPGEGMPMSTGEMPVSAAAPVSVNTSLSLIPSSCNNNMTMADISGTNVMITTNAIMSTSCYQPQQPDMGMTYSSPATTMLPPASQILPVSTSNDLLPPVTSQQQFTTLLPPSSQPQQMYNVGPIQPMETERVLQLKQEDPQTVPNLGLSGLSPPMSPINMEVQEKVKLERKRERNRVAARKCRTRKLERISRLEDRVSDLKGQNSELVTTATKLRDQVARLKTQIMEHMNTGCKVMIGQDLL